MNSIHQNCSFSNHLAYSDAIVCIETANRRVRDFQPIRTGRLALPRQAYRIGAPRSLSRVLPD